VWVQDEKVVTDGDSEDWWESVEELVLEHQRVRRLQNLERLTKMRRASFCDNELTRVEGLECCTSLEELSLEGNRITAVEGLSTLINLKTLDLGKNKIPQVQGLEMLTWLTQLSIEDNEIESLAGLSALSCLMELYIGNNNISQLREVQQLRDMPKLIILDLLGNPLCQTEDYRLYVVYYMRKLKVLDGLGIEVRNSRVARLPHACPLRAADLLGSPCIRCVVCRQVVCLLRCLSLLTCTRLDVVPSPGGGAGGSQEQVRREADDRLFGGARGPPILRAPARAGPVRVPPA
jgi:hypothetical protein